MPEIINKIDLQRPYTLNVEHPVSSSFSCVYMFADSGEIGEKPPTILDLLGQHNLAMTYGASGSLVDNGDLQLADNGNGQINTYGEFSGVDQTWSSGLTGRSRIYLVDVVFKANTKNYQNLFDGPGILVRWAKSTGELSINIENISSHRISATYTPVDNERLVIGLLIDQTNATAHIVVNGVELTSTVNGFPFSGAQTKPSYNPWLGRQNSWNNYYGWDGKLNLFAFGYDFNGNEPTAQELIDLTLNPYAFLNVASVQNPVIEIVASLAEQTEDAKVASVDSRYHLELSTAAQVEDAQTLIASTSSDVTSITGEQSEDALVVNHVNKSNVVLTLAEQREESAVVSTSTSTVISPLNAEQVEDAAPVSLFNNGKVSVFMAEQIEESSPVLVSLKSHVSMFNAHQTEDALTLSLSGSDRVIVSFAEQQEQASSVSVAQAYRLETSLTEQIEEGETVFITSHLDVDLVNAQQVEDGQSLSIPLTLNVNSFDAQQGEFAQTIVVSTNVTIESCLAEQLEFGGVHFENAVRTLLDEANLVFIKTTQTHEILSSNALYRPIKTTVNFNIKKV